MKKSVLLSLIAFLTLALSGCQPGFTTSIPPAATVQPPMPAAATSVPPTATPHLTATPIPPTQTPKPPPATPAVNPTPANRLGDTWTRPADNMVMVYVPGGKFEMGTADDQLEYNIQLCGEAWSRVFGVRTTCDAREFADERPAHVVTLDGFWIDRLEVTNGQYRRCVGAGACTPPVESGSYTRDAYYGDSAYDDYPVVWVGWGQAAEYCAWAGARLPTEAEWEYAARGPESWIFPWGDTFDGTRLNYCDVNCTLGVTDKGVNDGYYDTAPVGTFPSGASWCGALDMAGNVREWVAGWFGAYHGPQVNPTGPSSGEMIVSRGGCWLDDPENVRSANRGQNTPDYTRFKLGFRCARE